MVSSRLQPTIVLELAIILVVCSVIYLSNGITIGSGDTIPNSLVAFNLLENHTLHFDIMRQAFIPSAAPPYAFFDESVNGHLTSHYPIGPAIVTFPLYLLFYIYLKLASIPINLADGSFDQYRLLFEKLAATFTAALSVLLFYLASRSRFSRGISLATAGIFAFATNTWVTSSQGLWQHGISNLMILSALVCLLMTHRASERPQIPWLFLAGIAAGLLPSIRPTSGLVTIALLVYVLVIHRYRAVPFVVGLLSALPGLAWNLYYFGNISGGYSSIVGSLYRFTGSQFIESFMGLLISPSRGLIIFSPVLLFAVPGLVSLIRLRYQRDEQLLLCLGLSNVVIFATYCFYTIWWGGHCYGPRFMTDCLPVICYGLNYTLAEGSRSKRQWWGNIPHFSLLFSVLLIFSIWVQIAGAFGLAAGVAGRTEPTANFWNEVPIDLDQPKLWDLQDNQIRRHTASVLHRLVNPPVTSLTYQQNLQGAILSVTDVNGVVIPQQFTCAAGGATIFSAKLKNTGLSTWFGYMSALERGEARVQFSYYGADGGKLTAGKLYIADQVMPGRRADAIGLFLCPYSPGTYYLVFDLITEQVGEIHMDKHTDRQRLTYTLNVVASH